MADQHVLEVRQGIWIDGQWIDDAGLGSRLEVVVMPGEIRLLPVHCEVEHKEPVQGWDTFRSLGDDASPGRLTNAAANHNQYLYGESR